MGKSSAVGEGKAEGEVALARFTLCLHHRATATVIMCTGRGGGAAILQCSGREHRGVGDSQERGPADAAPAPWIKRRLQLTACNLA